MLDSILELITQAASSSTFIFCFCNLIIVIILLDLKPSLNVHQKSEIHLSICESETQKQEINSKNIESLTQEKEVPRVVIDVEAKEEEEEEVEIEIENNDDVEIENNDDELRKRVEEFIEKVNKKWKEELLSTSTLVYGKSNNGILAI